MSNMIRIQPATRGGITALDVCEMYGLGFHLGGVVELLTAACRTHPVDKHKIEKARTLLQRFFADPHKCIQLPRAEDDALSWASPQKIVASLGLKDTPALAVTYILNAAAFQQNRDCELELSKALVQLEKQAEEQAR